MRKRFGLLLIVMACLLLAFCFGQAEGEKALTLMVYMCGSNLESDYGAATQDILEMAQSGFNESEVNLLLMTGGSRDWSTGQNPEQLLISEVTGGGLNPVRAAKSTSMGSASTLAYFLKAGFENYPAKQYALILWDHGGGPLMGVCVDELYDSDILTLAEISAALKTMPGGKKLSWIGFDACLMGSAEVAVAMSSYADYMIASQETEPGTGWDYSFLRGIERDADGAETGKRIVDAYFQATNQYGITLSCLDLSKAQKVSSAMGDYFGALSRNMGVELFGRLSRIRMSTTSFGKAPNRASAGYDLADLAELVRLTESLEDASALKKALEEMVVYSRSSGIQAGGVTVYHPMRNKTNFARAWREQYANLDFSSGYKQYVNEFGSILTGKPLADWSGIRLRNEGMDDQGTNRFSLQLEADQQASISSARLIVLAMSSTAYEGDTSVQLTEGGVSEDQYSIRYYPVSVTELTSVKNGRLEAAFTGSSLYVVNEQDEPVAGPVSYERDGDLLYISARYMDNSGREDTALPARVIHVCRVDEAKGEAPVLATYVYDRMTDTYTSRISISEDDYTDLWISRGLLSKPAGNGILPGLEEWEETGNENIALKLPLQWKLKFLDEQLSGTPLYATIQITDTQQNSRCTPLTQIENPNLHGMEINPRSLKGDDFSLKLYAVQDASRLNPGISLGAELTNTAAETLTYHIERLVFNNGRTVYIPGLGLYFGHLAPGETSYSTCRVEQSLLLGLPDLTEISMIVRSQGEDNKTRSENRYTCTVRGYQSVSDGNEDKVLSAMDEGNLRWELISLTPNAQGGIDGLMRVENNGEKNIFLAGNMVVNDTVQTDDRIYVRAEAHTDVMVPFTISNRAVGSDLVRISGLETYYTLALDNLLQQYGVGEIETLKYCISEEISSRQVVFRLDNPMPFATEEEVRLAQANAVSGAPRVLLEGDISVNVDRIVVADNGVMVRMTVRNNSDRDIDLKIDDKFINDHYAFSLGGDRLSIGAGASTVTCVSFRPYLEDHPEDRRVSSLAMSFRYEGFTTNRASIRLNRKTAMGAERGTYLSAADFTVTPTEYHRPTAIRTDPTPLQVADSEISLSFKVGNSENYVPEDVSFNTSKIEMRFLAENKSQDVLRYRFDDFVLNDVRTLGDNALAFTMDVNPGESAECSETLEPIMLTNLEEIRSVSCTMQVERRGDNPEKTDYTIRFQVYGFSLNGFAPSSGDPVAETVRDGVTWRLYALEVQENGQIEGLVSIHNNTDTPLEDKYLDIMMEGVQAGGTVNGKVPAGCEWYTRLRFINGALLDYPIKAAKLELSNPYEQNALQRLGIESVSLVELLIEQRDLKGTIDGTVLWRLPRPLKLPSVGLQPTMQKGGTLLKGDVSVTVTSLLTGDNGVALTLVMRNETAVPVLLEAFMPMLDGMPLGRGESWCLPPHAIRVENIGLDCKDLLESGDKYREITMNFLVDGDLYEGASIRPGSGGTIGEAKRTEGTKLTVKTAKARTAPVVMEKVAVPAPASTRSVGLEAPISKKNADEIDFVNALICARETEKRKGDREEETEVPRRRVLTQVPLSNRKGGWMSDYSGMTLQYSNWNRYFSVETQAGNGSAKLTRDLVIFTKDEPLEGDFPEAGPEALDHGILAHYEWTVKYNNRKIEVSGAKCTMTDIATGKKVDSKKVTFDTVDRAYYGQPLIYPGDPVEKKYRYASISMSQPNYLQMNAVEKTESSDLCVIYEVHYKDGHVNWLEEEYR